MPGDAPALLVRYVDLHNEGVRSGDFAAMIALFDPEAEMRFEGIPYGPFEGRDAIARAFREHPPSDELALLVWGARDADRAEATYAWRLRSGRSAGVLGLRAAGGRIGLLSVRAE